MMKKERGSSERERERECENELYEFERKKDFFLNFNIIQHNTATAVRGGTAGTMSV